MNLGFSQRWADGMPTYFIEKIWQGIFLDDEIWHAKGSAYDHFQEKHYEKFNRYFEASLTEAIAPKIHTIRAGHRWKTGDKLHMVINNRQKNRFQFAPVLEAKSVQDFEIKDFGIVCTVNVDDEKIAEFHDGLGYQTTVDFKSLCINDGFDNELAFMRYFKGDFKGQIIHWTNHRYNL